ncbi:MAG: PhoH family protein [Candidatus Omnitrophota bacterium]|nr:PhoH family protein [Candidatus Omnitrophota bacterium]
MEKTLTLNSNQEAIRLYGSLDENLRHAEEKFKVRLAARNDKLRIIGSKAGVEGAYRFFLNTLEAIRGGPGPAKHKEAGLKKKPARRESTYEPASEAVRFYHRGKSIRPHSVNQEHYLAAIRDHDVVICIGPAGTGKTYLAMAAALDHLKRKVVSRIVLTRPAVEAGENLGFLPGDLYAKVNPYLRPLYDALYDMMDYEEANRNLERGVIEVAPLAYMRGRTLNDSFVILDEGQNCTSTQVKMFLTRLGEASKTVLTGDVTQIDLPSAKQSGLIEAREILASIKGISICQLTETDVVRHPLVREIIAAYDRHQH